MMLMVMMMMPCKLLTWHLVLTPFLSLFFEVALRDWTFCCLKTHFISCFLTENKFSPPTTQAKYIPIGWDGGSILDLLVAQQAQTMNVCQAFIQNLPSNHSAESVHWRNYNWVLNKQHCCSISAKYLGCRPAIPHQLVVRLVQEVQRVDNHAARLSFLELIEVSIFVFCLMSFVFCILLTSMQQGVCPFCYWSKSHYFVPLSTSPHPQVTIAWRAATSPAKIERMAVPKWKSWTRLFS